MSKQILLNHGYVALVDDADYDWLVKQKWQAKRVSGEKLYACNSENRYMHRVIMNPSPQEEVDHIDGNGLNNQRSNLRNATHSQNLQNRGAQGNNRSGHKGVSLHRKRWRAVIYEHGKQFFLGYFNSPQSAARAYDDAAKSRFGEFAKPNSKMD